MLPAVAAQAAASGCHRPVGPLPAAGGPRPHGHPPPAVERPRRVHRLHHHHPLPPAVGWAPPAAPSSATNWTRTPACSSPSVTWHRAAARVTPTSAPGWVTWWHARTSARRRPAPASMRTAAATPRGALRTTASNAAVTACSRAAAPQPAGAAPAPPWAAPSRNASATHWMNAAALRRATSAMRSTARCVTHSLRFWAVTVPMKTPVARWWIAPSPAGPMRTAPATGLAVSLRMRPRRVAFVMTHRTPAPQTPSVLQETRACRWCAPATASMNAVQAATAPTRRTAPRARCATPRATVWSRPAPPAAAAGTLCAAWTEPASGARVTPSFCAGVACAWTGGVLTRRGIAGSPFRDAGITCAA
jgi:hypothetical protein